MHYEITSIYISDSSSQLEIQPIFDILSHSKWCWKWDALTLHIYIYFETYQRYFFFKKKSSPMANTMHNGWIVDWLFRVSYAEKQQKTRFRVAHQSHESWRRRGREEREYYKPHTNECWTKTILMSHVRCDCFVKHTSGENEIEIKISN